MSILRALLTLCLLFISTTAYAPSTLAEDEERAAEGEVTIEDISFKGVNSLKLKKLKKNMATPFPSKIKFWVEGPEFDEETLKQDLLRIRRVYANHGYYDASASYDLKYSDLGERVKIRITVDEGMPVVLRKLDLELAHPLDERLLREISESLALKPQGVFSARGYEKSKVTIVNILNNNGYPRATVKGEALVNRREKWAEARFAIDPGRLYRFGISQVFGNERVKSNVITREVNFRKGDIYSERKIGESQSRIFMLGLFSSVLLDTSLDDQRSVVNVRINVRERKYSSIGFGVGYGTEDLLRGQLVWLTRNFLGGGRTLRIAGKFSFLTQRIENEFVQPHLLGDDSSLSVSVDAVRDDFLSFTSENLLGKVELSKGITGNYSVSGGYTLRGTRVVELGEEAQEFVEGDEFILSIFGLTFSRSTVRDLINPKRGTLAELSVESSVGPLGSDNIDYLKWTLSLKGYKRLAGTVLASRLDVGVLQPYADTDRLEVPIFSRFFAGGSNTVRGFAFQKLGPLDENEEPIGGNTLLVGSLESRFPIHRNLGGVVFFDFGNVHRREWDFELDDIKYSPGVGLRYDTIIGPLRVDFGYAINPDSELRNFQFFFSIGQAF